MQFKHVKMTYDDTEEFQITALEELRQRFPGPGQLELMSAWTGASEIERSRWRVAAERQEARMSEEDLGSFGATYSLVEELIRDRAFGEATGVYLNTSAGATDLVYAAKRLIVSGYKVAYLDWDLANVDLAEELLADTEVPVIQMGTGELVLTPGATGDEWEATVHQAAEMMAQLQDVDVLLFLADSSALEDVPGVDVSVPRETLSLSAAQIGRVAGAWGASVLVGGNGGTIASPKYWADLVDSLVAALVIEEIR